MFRNKVKSEFKQGKRKFAVKSDIMTSASSKNTSRTSSEKFGSFDRRVSKVSPFEG